MSVSPDPAPAPVSELQSAEVLRLSRAIAPVLRDFFLAFKDARLLPLNHPVMVKGASRVTDGLNALMTDRKIISIDIAARQFLLDDTPVIGLGQTASRLLAQLRARKIGRINFKDGIGPQDLLHFLDVLINEPVEAEEPQLAGKLASLQVTGLTIEPRQADEEALDDEEKDVELLVDPCKVYQVCLDIIKECFVRVRAGDEMDEGRLNYLVDNLIQHVQHGHGTLLALTAGAAFEEFQYVHPLNTAILAAQVGATVTDDRVRLRELIRAALLHDFGQVVLAAGAAATTGEADPNHYHPLAGATYLDQFEMIEKLVMVVAFEHHLQFDGGGFPPQVKARPLNLFSSIVGICDAYNELVSNEEDGLQMSPAEALAGMKDYAGKFFEPELFNRFLEVIGHLPVGSLVQLDNGALGVVITANAEYPDRPQVRVVADVDGQLLATPIVVDLSREEERSVAWLVDARKTNLDPMAYL